MHHYLSDYNEQGILLYLRKFVLVFFDDILIFSSSRELHFQHLQSVLLILRVNKLYAKKSKCMFFQEQLQFLGHVILGEGVTPNLEKISAIQDLPSPSTVKPLRGFISLSGYYRKFVRNYAHLASPMTDLLKKDHFVWSQAAKDSFKYIKDAIMSTPILHHPNFSKPFTIETYTYQGDVGDVLS